MKTSKFQKGWYSLLFLLLLTSSTALMAQKNITFYANISEATTEGWAGHVWAGFSNGISEEVYGFYPDGIRNDSGRHGEVNYTFPVSEEGFAKALKVVEEFRNARYFIGFKDCRSFAQSVASAAGLNTPSLGIKSPAEWLGALLDLN